MPPRSFLFLGKRIIEELYFQLERSRPQWKLDSIHFKTPAVPVEAGLTRKAADPTQENWHWKARKVSEAISIYTGSLLDPGPYVRADMVVAWSALPLRTGDPEIAWFFGKAETEEGPAYVTLIGSVDNFNGYTPTPVENRFGWTPSTDGGIYEAISSLYSADVLNLGNTPVGLGADEPRTWAGVSDSAEIKGVDVSSLPIALGESLATSNHLLDNGWADGIARKDVLFRVAEAGGDLDGIARAYLGTPLWVADPIPKADRRLIP